MNIETKYKPFSMVMIALLGVGVLSWVLSFFAEPRWSLIVINFMYFVGISEAAITIVVILRTANVKWARSLYRVGGLVTMSFLPLAVALFIVLLLGQGAFFYWIGGDGHGPANPWLNPLFFTVRELLFFALFYFFAWRIFNVSMKAEDLQEHDTDRSLLFLGVPLMIIFVVHQSIMGWDLAMTLFPHFLSTIYTIRFWVTNVYGGFASMILIFAVLKRYFNVNITAVQFYHFGNLLLAFSIFWIYFTWADFFPFWYANLPEETPAIYSISFSPEFGGIYNLRLALGAIPFVILTLSKVRKSAKALQILAVPILIGIWIERYLMVVVPLIKEEQMSYSSMIGPTNILFSIGILGGFIALLLISITRHEEVLTRVEVDTGHH